MCSITWLFFFPFAGVRRMWMNVPQTRVWMEASVSTTWTALSVCVTWITQGYTAKWTSATSTCMSSWVCGKISSSWCPTSWSVSTMSQKSSGVSRSTIRPLPVHYDCTGLNSVWMEGHSELHLNKCRRTKGRNRFLLLCLDIWMC